MGKKTHKTIERSGLGLPFLIGAAFGLTFCFFSVTEVFAANRVELLFNFKDFLPWILIAAFCFAVIAASLIWLPGKKIGRIVGAVFVWLTVMGYVQSTFLNGTAGLAGDDREAFETGTPAVINLIIWIVALASIVVLALRLKEETVRTVAAVAMIAVIGMQAAGLISNLPRLTRDRFEMIAEAGSGDSADENEMLIAASYLSTDGRTETASKNNVYVLILDRLDVSYINYIFRTEPDFFEPLTGFTYYGDNLSLYSRTFPAAATIIAGQDGDLSVSNEAFFQTVYGTSPFLKDLKDNGYKVKLYAPAYYAYRSGRSLYGIADNMASYTGYHVTMPLVLSVNLLRLSLYKALPTLFKPLVAISTQSFDYCVEYDTSSPLAGLDDFGFYQELTDKGLTDGGYENAYNYLHFHGAHDPYVIDENVNEVDEKDGTSNGQIKGDFRILYELFDQLKAKGLYEQATIIITGDHPSALSDVKVPTQSRVTSLFVKEAGRSDEPFTTSSAQVSQANLAATIVKSAGIVTSHDYGPAYSEVPEGVDQVRWHQFQQLTDEGNLILRFRVEGRGTNFKNWTLESSTNIGDLYK